MQLLPAGRLHVRWYTQSRQESSGPDHTSVNARANVTRTRPMVWTREIMRICYRTANLGALTQIKQVAAAAVMLHQISLPLVQPTLHLEWHP
jgi:hypothetical protein